jgi:hypothetical protein
MQQASSFREPRGPVRPRLYAGAELPHGKVGIDGRLRLAPRRSEHVDRATEQQVLAVGEAFVARSGR